MSDMLNRGLGGAVGFGTDIGGYFDYSTPPTTEELFNRWAEWAALSPVFRLHGSGRAGTHTPWQYGQDTVDRYKRLSRLHLAARPLIMRLWREAASTGAPIARPLWWHHPDDPVARRQDQEWLLGPDVLVAPVVKEGARARSVYFPGRRAGGAGAAGSGAQCWVHPETGERFVGPGTRRVRAPLGRLSYFFRCGTQPFAVPPPSGHGGGPKPINGTAGDDVIRGTSGNDVTNCGAGDDRRDRGTGDSGRDRFVAVEDRRPD